jgi:hypothetical protein
MDAASDQDVEGPKKKEAKEGAEAKKEASVVAKLARLIPK